MDPHEIDPAEQRAGKLPIEVFEWMKNDDSSVYSKTSENEAIISSEINNPKKWILLFRQN